jgi:hypothetical protein
MGTSRSGKHLVRRPDTTDSRHRAPRARRQRPRSRWAWPVSGAAFAAAAALVAAGLTGAFSPASQSGRPDASSQPAGTEFGAWAPSLTALSHDTSAFGQLPVIRFSHIGVPPRGVWTHGPIGANKSAVVISFTSPPAKVLSGADDHALASFFDAAPAGFLAYYAYDPDPELAIAQHRFTASQYQQAWAHIVTIADSANNPDLKSTLILHGTDAAAGAGRSWRQYLPGGNVISTLAWDAYPAGTVSGNDPQLTPPATFMGPAVAAARSAGLRFGISGFALATAQGRPAWLKEVADYLMNSGALFGILRPVRGVAATELTDPGSIAAWREVVAANGTSQPAGGPASSPPVPAPTATTSSPATPVPTPTASQTTQPNPTPDPTTSAPAPSGPVCSTSAAKGECGPYGDSQITSTTSNTSVGNNVWAPISGWQQTLHAANPGDWSVTSNMPAGNTAVVSYPSLGANFGLASGGPTPLSDFASVYSSFSEDMHATSATSAWAAYDIWVGPSSATSPSNEVMIQTDFANNGPCTAEASASFGGSGGVPVQKWNLCQFGSELVWKLTGGNEDSGSVDLLGMLTWLEDHGYLPADSGLFLLGYGWEICSTGGQNETFQLSNFSFTATK